MEVGGVAGDDSLSGSLGANRDVGIDDVGGCGACEQQADSRCIGSVEWDKVRAGLPAEPREAGLPGWVANGLRQGRRRDGYSHPALGGSHNERDDAPIIAIQRDQPAGIEGDSAHAARPVFDLRFSRWGARIPSAQGW
jgi:hypothetical protein